MRTIGLNDQRCQEEDSHNDEEQRHCWCKCAIRPLLVQMCKTPRKNLQLAHIIPRITNQTFRQAASSGIACPASRMREFAHGGWGFRSSPEGGWQSLAILSKSAIILGLAKIAAEEAVRSARKRRWGSEGKLFAWGEPRRVGVQQHRRGALVKSTPEGFPKSGSVLSHDHQLTRTVIFTHLLYIERVFPVGSIDLLTL